MKVRMRVEMSGTLNGEPYPRLGEVGEVPDVVGEKLVASGLAVKAGAPLDDADRAAREGEHEDEVETRPAAVDEVENATVPAVTRRGPGRPRKT